MDPRRLPADRAAVAGALRYNPIRPRTVSKLPLHDAERRRLVSR